MCLAPRPTLTPILFTSYNRNQRGFDFPHTPHSYRFARTIIFFYDFFQRAFLVFPVLFSPLCLPRAKPHHVFSLSTDTRYLDAINCPLKAPLPGPSKNPHSDAITWSDIILPFFRRNPGLTIVPPQYSPVSLPDIRPDTFFLLIFPILPISVDSLQVLDPRQLFSSSGRRAPLPFMGRLHLSPA